MPFGYWTFYHSKHELLVCSSGHGLNKTTYSERTVLDHLNTEIVHYSDPHCSLTRNQIISPSSNPASEHKLSTKIFQKLIGWQFYFSFQPSPDTSLFFWSLYQCEGSSIFLKLRQGREQFSLNSLCKCQSSWALPLTDKKMVFEFVHHSGDLKSEHVQMSNSQSLSCFWMVRILNGSFSLDCFYLWNTGIYLQVTGL